MADFQQRSRQQESNGTLPLDQAGRWHWRLLGNDDVIEHVSMGEGWNHNQRVDLKGSAGILPCTCHQTCLAQEGSRVALPGTPSTRLQCRLTNEHELDNTRSFSCACMDLYFLLLLHEDAGGTEWAGGAVPPHTGAEQGRLGQRPALCGSGAVGDALLCIELPPLSPQQQLAQPPAVLTPALQGPMAGLDRGVSSVEQTRLPAAPSCL